MKEQVHILATCRGIEHLPMTELVFKTLRVGFPTYPVTVHLNNLSEAASNYLRPVLNELGCGIVECNTVHQDWIRDLAHYQPYPFWILDTDVILYESIEQFEFKQHLTGFRIPQWNDEFSGCITRPRLHTSLLRIDPVTLRDKVNSWREKIAKTQFTPVVDLFSPLVVPLKGKSYFYDTCSLLFHAVGGEAFQPKHKEAYFHFHWGSIPDVVLPRLSDKVSQSESRKRILNNPVLGRGVWREQEQFFSERAA